MNAPDFKTLYQIEQLMECGPGVAGAWGAAYSAGIKGVLLANSIGNMVATDSNGVPAIYTQRDQVIEITPRVELKWVHGAATGHQSMDASGIFRYDAWDYTLDILFVTDRTENFQAHNVMLGGVRNIFENLKTYVNLAQFFPYTWIALAKQAGTIPGFHADENTDQSLVKYTGVVFILPNSWPT